MARSYRVSLFDEEKEVKFIEYATRYSKGEKFPDTPAFEVLKGKLKEVFGSTSPKVVEINLNRIKRILRK